MSKFKKVQEYLGLTAAPALGGYQRSGREAQLFCHTCGAVVAFESQALHSA